MKSSFFHISFVIFSGFSLLFLSACKRSNQDGIVVNKGQEIIARFSFDPSAVASIAAHENGEIVASIFRKGQCIPVVSVKTGSIDFLFLREGVCVLSGAITTNSVDVLTFEQKDKNTCFAYTFNENGEMIPVSRMTVRDAKAEKLEIFMNGEFVPAEQRDCKWWIGDKIAKYTNGYWLLIPVRSNNSSDGK